MLSVKRSLGFRVPGQAGQGREAGLRSGASLLYTSPILPHLAPLVE